MLFTRRRFIATSAATFGLAAGLPRVSQFGDVSTLKALYGADFLIGNIVKAKQLKQQDTKVLALLAHEFNALTMENAMKWEQVHPTKGEWNFGPIDQFLNFCAQHQMKAVGHVLVWHSQTPKWVFEDEGGNALGRDKLLKRMNEHIAKVAGHSKGRIWAWDVVNEAIEDDGSMRKSPWQQQIGDDFINHAFAAAHAADPDALLLYNDYSMHRPDRRNAVVRLIRRLKKQNIPIHGIGMQGHITLDYPALSDFEDSIKAFIAEGVKVHITELDIDVLPNPFMSAEISTRFEYSLEKDPYIRGLPVRVANQQADRAEALFKMLLKYSDHIERVSFWGLADHLSWKNNFPIRGRTNYPLLYDRNFDPKPMLERIKKLNS